MSGEVKSWWHTRIAQLERDPFFKKRYATCAKEPKALFNRIGEDLDSTNEKIREAAFWLLVYLTPELTNILHEKETREPGWREIKGEDQKIVNEGIDGTKCIYKHLHTKFVKEHRFKVLDVHKKDPRPYLKKVIERWEKDEERKRKNRDGALREVPLDYESALEIPDPAGSPEDYVLDNKGYEELKSEFRGLGFWRNDAEQDLFCAYHIDDRPLDEIRERLGISYKATSDTALRKRRSRINKNIVAGRDAVFSFLLLTGDEFAKTGKIPLFHKAPERSEEWVRRAKQSVRPGAWIEAPVGQNDIAVRPLTTGLRGAPGHIYLFAIRKDNLLDGFFNHELMTTPRILADLYLEDADNMMACRLEEYSTEVPGLNKALAELPHDYPYAWLVSNSLPVKSYFS